jgi:hypothetical protein
MVFYGLATDCNIKHLEAWREARWCRYKFATIGAILFIVRTEVLAMRSSTYPFHTKCRMVGMD